MSYSTIAAPFREELTELFQQELTQAEAGYQHALKITRAYFPDDYLDTEMIRRVAPALYNYMASAFNHIQSLEALIRATSEEEALRQAGDVTASSAYTGFFDAARGAAK
jgi:hypothetical protein